MKTIFRITSIFITALAIFSCQKEDSFNRAKWEVVNLNYTGDLDDIFALPNDTIMLISRFDDTYQKTCIFESDDAAKTWKQTCFDTLSTRGFPNLYCFNHLKIYCGNFKTYDGGKTWKKDGFAGTPSYFFNNDVGFYLWGSSIYKTTDGGMTAKLVFDRTAYDGFQFIQFFNNRIGYASGGASWDSFNSGIMVKTTDGGNTWQQLPGKFKHIDGMSFISADIGYIVIDLHEGSVIETTLTGAELLKTTDGGITWTSIYKAYESQYFARCNFVDEQHGFVLGVGTICSTSDGGKTWVQEHEIPSSDYAINKMIFTSSKTGYAVGNNGLLLKRTTY